MQTDPMEEWRRLTALYSDMGDVEIRELADQINDLTETAQQILRNEMKKRGIIMQEINPEQVPVGSTAFVHWGHEENTAGDPDVDVSENESIDYTWKKALWRCESIDEAAARCEMLRRAGIESWIQRPGSKYVVPWLEYGVGDIQINVGADQLDEAQAIVGEPIPQQILDEIKEAEAAPDYQLPLCPKCRAADPTLESVDPSNHWLCESCGYTWSDPVEEDAAGAKSSA